jgi:hypothetical protein
MTPEPSACALVYALIGGIATWAVIIAVVLL